MTPRGRPKEFVREEALTRALEVFWAKGYAGAGLGDLTDAMCIGRQSLYDTFGDKRQLYLEALDAYCDAQEAEMGRIMESAGSPGQALATFLDSWADQIAGPMKNGCLVTNSIGEIVGIGDAEVVKALGGHMERFTRFVEDLVQAAMDSGEITTPLKARELASMVTSAAHGITVHARIADARYLATDVARSLKALLGL